MRRALPLVVSVLASCAGAASETLAEPDERLAVEREVTPAEEGSRPADPPPPRPELPLEIVDDFALLDERGRFHELYLSGDRDAVVIVSVDVDDSGSNRLLSHVDGAAATRADRVDLFYVSADPQDHRGKLRDLVAEHGLTRPLLRDEVQVVLRSLGVQTTGTAVVIDTGNWNVAYRGRIAEVTPDGEISTDYVGRALDAVLAGRRPDVERTAASGEPISARFGAQSAPSDARYARDIVPILERRCVPCHRDGGIAPWAMSSFERVRGWSPMMRETIVTKRMPPWSADKLIGRFGNDHSLEPREQRTLVDWIDDDCPRGDGEDRLPELSRPDETAYQWPHGEPDLVYELLEVKTPPTGLLPYIFDVVTIEAEEDLWVRGVSVLPSNQRILHHCLIILEYPEHLKHLEPVYWGGAGSTFGFYVPGGEPRLFPEGSGKFLPSGTRMVAQLHYVTTGKEEVDVSRIGLYLHDEKPPHEFETTSATGWDFEIPPGEPNYVIVQQREFDRPVIVYDMTPHMHYRGKEMRYVAIFPDGSNEQLLAVVNYDFNWQLSYFLETPRFLPAGTIVRCRGVFDNSARNPRNPDPTQTITFGLQSSDEMFIGYMNLREATPEEAERYAKTGDWR